MKVIKFFETKTINIPYKPATKGEKGINPLTGLQISDKYSDKMYPFKCKFKNRTPDPGICYILEINFEEKKVHWTNGAVRSIADFDDIEFIPDPFIFNQYNL